MKKITAALSVLLITVHACFCQNVAGTNRINNTFTGRFIPIKSSGNYSPNIAFYLNARFQRSVTCKELAEAKVLSALVPDFPSNWVNDYAGTEIIIKSSKGTVKAFAINNQLSAQQQDLLKHAEINSEIELIVKYIYDNAGTMNNNIHEMHYTMVVIPKVQAEYAGGKKKLMDFLLKNSNGKIILPDNNEQKCRIAFTVSSMGTISNAFIKESSGNEATDLKLLNLMKQMPDWKPALNDAGQKVSQDFELSIGNQGC